MCYSILYRSNSEVRNKAKLHCLLMQILDYAGKGLQEIASMSHYQEQQCFLIRMMLTVMLLIMVLLV